MCPWIRNDFDALLSIFRLPYSFTGTNIWRVRPTRPSTFVRTGENDLSPFEYYTFGVTKHAPKAALVSSTNLYLQANLSSSGTILSRSPVMVANRFYQCKESIRFQRNVSFGKAAHSLQSSSLCSNVKLQATVSLRRIPSTLQISAFAHRYFSGCLLCARSV